LDIIIFTVPTPKILRSPNELDASDIRAIYDGFNAPITTQDCGRMCAPHNPNGKPFCCDICHAVPAAYRSEWGYLQSNTDLWHPWRGDECGKADDIFSEKARIEADTPDYMTLLACLGPESCQRNYRALSCRQFPFFPYVTADYRFIGLAYEWAFERTCWVISHLEMVTAEYRQEFIQTFDLLFAFFQEELESYVDLSEKMRTTFIEQRRRIPILHRKGGYYLLSPNSDRVTRVDAGRLPKFGIYR
jgi:hypothetical protein